MLSNIVVGLSATVALFALLDVFLSDRQKEKLSSTVIGLWNWLDGMKALPYLDWVRHKNAKLLISIISVLIAIMVSPFSKSFIEQEAYEERLTYVLLVAMCVVGTILILVILSAKTNTRMVLRAVLLFLVVVLPPYALMQLEFVDDFLNSIIKFEGYGYLSLVAFFLVPASILVPLALFLVVPVVFLYVFICALYVFEFVIRRVAEYPKGPILAGSALLGSVVALVKLFN